MNIALFDLDGTLLEGDTDVLWGELLTRYEAFDPQTTAEFQQRYTTGDLDADDFVARFLSPLTIHGEPACRRWLEELLTEQIFPRLSPRVLEAMEKHRAEGHELVLATATNEFLTAPIATPSGKQHSPRRCRCRQLLFGTSLISIFRTAPLSDKPVITPSFT